ncbi:hypothetical protein [Alkalihalobacillus deserti]|uniref:hypothetical protein n=1 Tax=Alkalihalobacillus deserti TaxID=2879466 RepID=UPI001D14A004|nr:hypothetical protein [Alkalihalobacillus deserti]
MERSELILKELQLLNRRVNEFDSNMVTKHDLGSVATKKDLENMVMKHDLESVATKKDLENMITKRDLENFATKKDLENVVTKQDFEQLSKKLDAIALQVAHNTEQEVILKDVSQKVRDHETDIRLIKRMMTNK